MGRRRYDSIGVGYAGQRTPDPRWETRIHAALSQPSSLLNIGAGTGNYEPIDVPTVAVEPSAEMVSQRPDALGPAVRGVADAIPVADGALDAALGVLTVHHWPDPYAGLAEVVRATRGVRVVVTFATAPHHGWWLVTDYFPEVAALTEGSLPEPDVIADLLGGGRVEPMDVPHDCIDGFMPAYWRRPEAYLEPAVRQSISGLALLPADVIDRGVADLRRDLESGEWDRRNGHLRDLDTFDAGFRLVVANAST